MRYRMKRQLTAIIATLIGVLFTMCGCADESKLVIFTIPQGFRGGIRLDIGNVGTDSRELNSADAPVIEIAVPADGVVTLHGTDPYSNWAQTQAKFSDGTVIPLARSEPPGVPPLAPAVVKVWVEVDKWVFIGNDNEFAEWIQKRTLGKILRD